MWPWSYGKNSFPTFWIILHVHQTRTTCCIQGDFLKCWYIQDLTFLPGLSWSRDGEENYSKLHWSWFKRCQNTKILDFVCTSCAMGKLILRSSPLKIHADPLKFLECIQGDICGPIQPLSGPFRYFMVLVDTSVRWSHVWLLSIRNHAFAKLMQQVIRLKTNFPEHQICSI
jgi:hypothetical protein